MWEKRTHYPFSVPPRLAPRLWKPTTPLPAPHTRTPPPQRESHLLVSLAGRGGSVALGRGGVGRRGRRALLVEHLALVRQHELKRHALGRVQRLGRPAAARVTRPARVGARRHHHASHRPPHVTLRRLHPASQSARVTESLPRRSRHEMASPPPSGGPVPAGKPGKQRSHVPTTDVRAWWLRCTRTEAAAAAASAAAAAKARARLFTPARASRAARTPRACLHVV
jgi:hypothetical protein